MNKRNSWLRAAAVVTAAAITIVLVLSPAAHSKPRKKKEAEPTATLTPTPTPTPEAHVWNFDSDKAGAVPAGWKPLEGEWQVIPDPTAPSKPNTFGLPAGRLLKSLTSALEYYPMAVQTDPTEYSDFTLEAQFKSAGGRFDCSGGLIFRYVDEKNFYLLSAGCPSDYFALSRMTNGQLVGLKQSVVPTDKDTWYRLKVAAQGGHFICYDDNKMVFDFDDNKIAKGKIGVWARDDSQAQFDDITLTVIGSGEGGGAAPAAATSP
ncbi:MAG TPA: family 16 glycoside hydrolase [Patescibacteria group bacterium]|nr:family 16 glycoside hydrolase [Patescibacteria group bacterium]